MKKILVKYTTLFFLTYFAACSVGYDSEKSIWNFRKGFSVEQIAPDTWTIDFVGNAFNDRAQMQKYSLRKASEIAKQNGFSHFIVLSGSVERSVQIVPGDLYLGSSNNANTAGGTFGGGESVNATSILTVKLLKNPTGVNGTVYDADFLLAKPAD